MIDLQKSPSHRSKALTQSARDESCVACGIQDGTIVWAHSNELEHGKGKGYKAHDLLGNYLCGKCHSEYDTQMSRVDRVAYFREWYPRTMVRVALKLARGELRL